MPNNKKLKGKHRQPKTTNLFVPPAAPKQPVPKKYGLDYSRFDVDSDDSDAERQALAAPEKLRRGRAPPPDPTDVRDLERELGAHLCGNQSVRRVHPTILHKVISRRRRGRAGSVER